MRPCAEHAESDVVSYVDKYITLSIHVLLNLLHYYIVVVVVVVVVVVGPHARLRGASLCNLDISSLCNLEISSLCNLEISSVTKGPHARLRGARRDRAPARRVEGALAVNTNDTCYKL